MDARHSVVVKPTSITRCFVAAMQVVIALPWLMLDHPAYGGPAMAVWLAIGAVATRETQTIPMAIVARARTYRRRFLRS